MCRVPFIDFGICIEFILLPGITKKTTGPGTDPQIPIRVLEQRFDGSCGKYTISGLAVIHHEGVLLCHIPA